MMQWWAAEQDADDGLWKNLMEAFGEVMQQRRYKCSVVVVSQQGLRKVDLGKVY